jgi:hypothetical protein
MYQAHFVDTRWIPSMSNYAEAKAHLAKTTPIRGREHINPLGLDKNSRRRTECQIHDRGEYIACELEGYELVKYYPDNTIVLNTYNQDNTAVAQFISALLPNFPMMHEKSECVYIEDAFNHSDRRYNKYAIGDNLVIRYTTYVQEGSDTNHLKPEVLSYTPSYKYKLKRAAMKELREKYHEFTAYVMTVASMTDDSSSLSEWKLKRSQVFEYMNTTDMSKWYEAAAAIVRHTEKSQYNYGTGWSFAPNPVAVKKYIDDMIKSAHHEELFELVEIPKGEHVANTNRKYTRGL